MCNTANHPLTGAATARLNAAGQAPRDAPVVLEPTTKPRARLAQGD